jgi:hypothetical protein
MLSGVPGAYILRPWDRWVRYYIDIQIAALELPHLSQTSLMGFQRKVLVTSSKT